MPGWSVMVLLLAFLAGVAGVTWYVIQELADVQISEHGWYALIAGGAGTILLTILLMWLVYLSARRGYDERPGATDPAEAIEVSEAVVEPTGPRGGARDRRRGRGGGVQQRPWRLLRNPFPPIKPLSPEQLERIHEASMRILEETGMEFMHPEALDILARAGAMVDRKTQRVRLDRGLVLHAVANAPSSFTLHARNPARNVEIGGDAITFCTVASTPNAHDRAGGRRPGNFKDYLDFLRLAQSLNCIHLLGGYPVEPTDLPAETRHLDCLSAFLTLTDKAFHAYSLGRTRILDAIEIVRIGHGLSRDELARRPSLFTIVNTNSPLKLDGPMIEGIIEMARMNQVVVVTPFTLSGAMAPATLAGALALQNAEALAGIALAQLVNPGAPCIYGAFTSNVDMKSGAPAFGTPEYVKATLAGGQLARRYGLPYRSSNANAANTLDAQAAYESMMSLWAAVMGHGNMIMHAAGWMEGGLVASFEKMVLDAELLQMMAETLQPMVVDDDALGVAAIAEVGPVATSSARRIRWPATRPRSTRRWSRTGATASSGRTPARRPPTTAARSSCASCWPGSSRLHSIRELSRR